MSFTTRGHTSLGPRVGALASRAGRPVKVAVAGVAVLAVGASAWAFTSGASAAEYSTVDAARRTVVGGVELTGTVTASGRADLSFATSGTLAKVAVEEGQAVAKGDVIARLDRTSLRRALTRARAAMDEAEAPLASDLEAQASGVLTSGSSSNTSGSTSGSTSANVPASTPRTSTSSTSTSTVESAAHAVSATTGKAVPARTATPSSAVILAMAAVTSAQQGVIQAQSSASAALASAETALSHQQQVCAEDVTSLGCAAALVAVQEAQSAVATAQTALQAAIEKLSAALDSAVTVVSAEAAGTGVSGTPSTGSGGSSGTPQDGSGSQGPSSGSSGKKGTSSQSPDPSGAGQGSSGQGSSGRGAAGSSTPGGAGQESGQTVTAATLAFDQASVDKAKAALLQAEADLADATLRSPVSGTVRVLDLAAGDSVSASAVVAVVVSDSVTAVDAAVEVTQVGTIAVDQSVEITLPGRGDAVEGTVASVAATPSSGTSTYAVRVLLDEPEMVTEGAEVAAGSGSTTQAPLGSSAAMTVITATTADAVSVPLSALATTSGPTGTVRVLADDVVENRRVTLGTVGGTHVAVTEGLAEGETVVLAEVGDDALDGAAGQVTGSRGGPGGAPGGSGGFPGGAGGSGGSGGAPGGGRAGR